NSGEVSPGLDRDLDGIEWVLRLPRRPDVTARLFEEQRILDFVGGRLSVAVPRWQIVQPALIAYRRLPGSPGLTLDADKQPIWHFDPTSPEFASALGRLIAELHALDPQEAAQAGVPHATMDDVRASWRAELRAVQAEFAIAADLLEGWRTWLDDDSLWVGSTVMTHGELYAAHVLVETPGRIVGVLDWTTAKVGDPALDFTYQSMMGPETLDLTVRAYREAGGAEHPNLARRCAGILAAMPITYGLFALRSGDPEHRATAAAMLDPQPD
ncbi:MAG TPA: macrolide 2'-phosphotransferase, partial [Myxococcota bacterium]|nr:macrolide 2'-phosphotransferase [Myxococcota bacterium]